MLHHELHLSGYDGCGAADTALAGPALVRGRGAYREYRTEDAVATATIKVDEGFSLGTGMTMSRLTDA